MSEHAIGDAWTMSAGTGPIIVTAVHDGHEIRDDLRPLLRIDDATRLREEDPRTGSWVRVGDVGVTVARSRFEVDLNRPRESAVYLTPDDAWGLEVWSDTPPRSAIEASLGLWDGFYGEMERLCDAALAEHGGFVVLDLHSYNHRRGGPEAAVDDPDANPEVNVGTESVPPAWRGLIERFISDLSAYPFDGGSLDVRENVRFRGGHFPRWVNGRYGDRACALAVEVKKFYMDEWSGEADEAVVGALGEALEATIAGLRSSLAG